MQPAISISMSAGVLKRGHVFGIHPTFVSHGLAIHDA